MSFKQKYLKYKNKYIELKNQIGGLQFNGQYSIVDQNFLVKGTNYYFVKIPMDPSAKSIYYGKFDKIYNGRIEFERGFGVPENSNWVFIYKKTTTDSQNNHNKIEIVDEQNLLEGTPYWLVYLPNKYLITGSISYGWFQFKNYDNGNLWFKGLDNGRSFEFDKQPDTWLYFKTK